MKDRLNDYYCSVGPTPYEVSCEEAINYEPVEFLYWEKVTIKWDKQDNDIYGRYATFYWGEEWIVTNVCEDYRNKWRLLYTIELDCKIRTDCVVLPGKYLVSKNQFDDRLFYDEVEEEDVEDCYDDDCDETEEEGYEEETPMNIKSFIEITKRVAREQMKINKWVDEEKYEMSHFMLKAMNLAEAQLKDE